MPRHTGPGSQNNGRNSGHPFPYSFGRAPLPSTPSASSQPRSSQSDSQSSSTRRSLSDLALPSPSCTLISASSSPLPPPPAYTVEPPLSPQQKEVLNRVLAGESLFITGPAGTGKSVLIRSIIQEFRRRVEESGEVLPELPVPPSRNRSQSASQRRGVKFSRLAVTASTGKAAENIGGGTVHSWAGIGLGQGYRQAILKKVQDKPAAECRWVETRLLIIDEISMIDGRLFMLLDYIGRRVRQNERPFGGIQLVVCGDFLQLPPVKKENEEVLEENLNAPDFAFQTPEWAEMFPISQTVCLREVFRQVDTGFAALLEDIRKGRATAETVREIAKLDRAVKYADGIEATSLFGTRRQVEDLNLRKLDALCSTTFRYRAIDLPGIDIDGEKLSAKKARIELDEKTIWPEQLVLKVGAQVMLLMNISEHRLVNGSKGRVVAFQTHEEASRTGTPIVGESRSGDDETWPLVEFIAPPHSSDPTLRKFLIIRSKREVVNANLTIKATRIQVPLMLAWGMTIHKAQGQTLDRLKIDFSKIFARGQSYSALSRAVRRSTLEVSHFQLDR